MFTKDTGSSCLTSCDYRTGCDKCQQPVTKCNTSPLRRFRRTSESAKTFARVANLWAVATKDKGRKTTDLAFVLRRSFRKSSALNSWAVAHLTLSLIEQCAFAGNTAGPCRGCRTCSCCTNDGSGSCSYQQTANRSPLDARTAAPCGDRSKSADPPPSAR